MSRSAPVTLKVIGEVAAGHPFAGEVGAGEAARIFTGGVVPAGADTIVIQENTTRDGDVVMVQKPTPRRAQHPRAGLDFERGQVLLRKGRRLTDRDVMLAAAMNHPARAGAPPAKGRGARHRRRTGAARQRTRAGRDRLFQRLRARRAGAREGAEVIDLGIVPDRLEDIAAACAARATPAPTSW